MEKSSRLEENHPSPDPPWPLPRTPQCELPVLRYEEPRCSQDQNPPELVNGLELEKETNDPQYLAESCRNLPKEYRSHIQDLLPPLQVHNEELATTDDLSNDKPTSPTR